MRAEGDRCALRECKSKGSPKDGIILVEQSRAMDQQQQQQRRAERRPPAECLARSRRRPPHSLGAQKRGASSTPACVMSAAMSFSSSSIFEPISSSARANQTERQRGAKRERDMDRTELRNNRSWHSSGLLYCLSTRRVCIVRKQSTECTTVYACQNEI